MSKAVMLSIQPKWCELIEKREKLIEVRKNRPKLKTPFKCYIYCTKGFPIVFGRGNKWSSSHYHEMSDWERQFHDDCNEWNGKIIGEFVCDRINRYGDYDGNTDSPYFITPEDLKQTCLTFGELVKYGRNDIVYGWHISDLVIYDNPRELGEFWVRSNHPDCDLCAHVPVDMSPDEFVWHNDFCGECHRLSYKSMWATHFRKRITRAPQSWMYCQPIEAN